LSVVSSVEKKVDWRVVYLVVLKVVQSVDEKVF
jgi:hypothetical protein